MHVRTLSVFAMAAATAFAQPATNYKGWPVAGGNTDNIHYSSLKQINRENVSKLQVAWTYDSQDSYQGATWQVNPIIVDGVLYTTTQKLRVVAVDATSGKELWSFDGWEGKRPTHRNRGVTYWSDGREARILVCLDVRLYSLDAKTGKLDPKFGTNGYVELREAFDREPKKDLTLSVTSPGVIYRDLIILGSSVPESLPSTPGDIRAYNVRTGKLAWSFRTIPRPGEFGHNTWPADAWKNSGGANNWAGMTVDVKRGLVFVPTGSAAFDYYGGDRHGDNLFANTILCLDATTGKRKWHFQTVKHDLWDLDFPSPPVLVTVRRNGKLVDAVAQAGKDGYVWVLNRETGESLFPLREVSAPASTAEGEQAAATQIVPTKPEPFTRQEMTREMASNRTPEVRKHVLQMMDGLDFGGRFVPPSTRGTIIFPGPSGGAEWGGSAWDPETRLYYVNANEMPWIIRLVPPTKTRAQDRARRIYASRCAACHRPDLKGAPPEYPSVDNLAGKFNDERLAEFIRKGSGRMPGFASIGEPAIQALVGYLLRKEDKEADVASGPQPPVQLKYTIDGMHKFLDQDGYPAITPPWGTLNAINLDTGEYAWKIPLGEVPKLAEQGLKNTGVENHGGAVVTAGGLLFIGATPEDRKFRAFDKLTGKLLWETTLPFGGCATPSVYEVKGRQYVVIAAGGGRGGPSGGTMVAFALPTPTQAKR